MGTVCECGADVEDTERCLHVPAMLLQALSANSDVAGTWKHISVLPRRWQGGGGGSEPAWLLVWPCVSVVDVSHVGACRSEHYVLVRDQRLEFCLEGSTRNGIDERIVIECWEVGAIRAYVYILGCVVQPRDQVKNQEKTEDQGVPDPPVCCQYM
jgi:hypothetical protein